MKTDIAVKNCDFLGYFTKNGKNNQFLSSKNIFLNRYLLITVKLHIGCHLK